MVSSQGPAVSKRHDPRYDARRLVVYFLGLIIFYAGVVAVMRPGQGEVARWRWGSCSPRPSEPSQPSCSPTVASSSAD
jgi:hypothetical protein